jgi:hypothetical protein
VPDFSARPLSAQGVLDLLDRKQHLLRRLAARAQAEQYHASLPSPSIEAMMPIVKSPCSHCILRFMESRLSVPGWLAAGASGYYNR